MSVCPYQIRMLGNIVVEGSWNGMESVAGRVGFGYCWEEGLREEQYKGAGGRQPKKKEKSRQTA